MNVHREHPLRILKYSIKNIWLLIFPLLRGISAFRYDKEWFYNWLEGAWFDILVICFIILFGLFQWCFSKIEIGNGSIVHKDGIFFRRCRKIPFCNVASVSVERPFYLSPFSAAKISCDTNAGIFRSPDMKLLVNEHTCDEIISHFPKVENSKKTTVIPKPTPLSVVLFSVFFSSGFSGAFYIAAFFFQGGNISRDIIGHYFSRISERTAHTTSNIVMRIPDAALYAAVFFISAWLLSFILNLLRYSYFDISSDKKYLYTSYGIFVKRSHIISAKQINYTDFRQNLFMKLFSAVAVYISCSGYGKGKSSLPVLLPVRKENVMEKELEEIGIFRSVKNEFKPKWSGYWNYVWQPVLIGISLIPLYYLSVKYIPLFSGLSFFVVIMLEIPSVWFAIVKTAAFFTSGISVYDDKVLLRCCKWSGFHTVIAERRKVVKLELEQTIFQKIGGRCSVSLWFEGEEHIRYKVKSFDERKAAAIAELLELNAYIPTDMKK